MVGALGLYACQAAFHELSYLSMDNALLFFLAGVTTAVHGQLLGQPRGKPMVAAGHRGVVVSQRRRPVGADAAACGGSSGGRGNSRHINHLRCRSRRGKTRSARRCSVCITRALTPSSAFMDTPSETFR